MPYYVVKDGQRVGPLDNYAFYSLVLSGEIGLDSLVWQPGMDDWKPYAVASDTGSVAAKEPNRVSSMAAGPPGDPEAVCVGCGTRLPNSELKTIAGSSVCASCKPLHLQRVREMAQLTHSLVYAGLGARWIAKVTDNIILRVVAWGLKWGLGVPILTVGGQPGQHNLVSKLVLSALLVVLYAAYTTFFLGRFGATPGKMAMGIRVVRANGEKLTYGRALARAFAEVLSALTLCIGYLMAFFDWEKRTLHDRICDTRVVED